MAEPKTAELNDQFASAAYEGYDGDGFWLGLRYDPNVGKFFWISENLEMTNPIWGPSQPDFRYGNCVVLYLGSSVWTMQDCNQLQSTICQTGKNIS